MNVYIHIKRGYDDFYGFGRRKNKANSKPNKLVLSAVEWSQSRLAPRPVPGVEKTKPICRPGESAQCQYWQWFMKI